MTSNTIHVHIDKIVFEGIGQLNRSQLALSLQHELHRLISSEGLAGSLNQSTSMNHINAKPISVGNPVREKHLGHQIARSVYRELKR